MYAGHTNTRASTHTHKEHTCYHPLTMPCHDGADPVGMTTASRWAHRSGSYIPKPRRPISVLFTGSYHNRYGDKPVRYALRNLLSPFSPGKENMIICAHSGLSPSTLCGVKRMYRNTRLTTYMIAAHADFCLEPGGDTPTRSHLYLAVLSGCIPVIFDHVCE